MLHRITVKVYYIIITDTYVLFEASMACYQNPLTAHVMVTEPSVDLFT